MNSNALVPSQPQPEISLEEASKENSKAFRNDISYEQVQDVYAKLAPRYEQPEISLEEASKENSKAFRNDISYEQVQEVYAKLAPKYEQILCPQYYKGPQYTAEALADQIPADLRSSFKILDVGAGTGFVGAEMKKHGFGQIDALEPSEKMITEAIKKNVYEKIYCSRIGGKPLDIKDDMYDGIVTCGSFGGNLIPCQALFDIIRIVKPGGIIVISLRESYLTESTELIGRFEPLMRKLESSGAWKLLKREVKPDYAYNKNGVTYTYKVCIHGTVDNNM